MNVLVVDKEQEL